MNEQSVNCAAYFKEHPTYHRILKLLFQKYKSFGHAAGTICLSDATAEEFDAARALFGHSFSAPLRIKTTDFEAALQETKYRGAVLKEVLECYFDKPIVTKREFSSQMDSLLFQLLRQAKDAAQSEATLHWLESLASKQGEGFHLIRKSICTDAGATRHAVLQACKCMDWLDMHVGEGVRLAVLSANATADPHALDSNTLCGKLFLHLLAARSGASFPTDAESRASLYYDNGILCDSISSSVTQVGLRLYTEGDEHPAYHSFRLKREPSVLTLTNLSGITSADSPSGKVYLVENQMVFSQLCDYAPQFHSPLICTSGQPTIAVIRLLDLLSANGTEFFYSGDFDGKGLSIAMQLLNRYPHQFHLWHMTADDYKRCSSPVRLSDASLSMLNTLQGTPLTSTAEAVRNKGYDGYQELLLPELHKDLVIEP